MSSAFKLFQPVKVGDVTLEHRVVLAPLTRFRVSDRGHVPLPNVKGYYAQRASEPGTLLISEAVFVSPQAGGYQHVPGIWSDEQIKAWKEVADRVHAQGSFIYMQIWAVGRAAQAVQLKEEDPSFDYVSSSDVKLTGRDETPRPLTMPEIKQYAQWFATGARNAVERAGFDGVEIHGAHGYLIDQFFQDTANKRTDEYGGSVENRARFGLEVVDAVVKAVGPQKVGIRLSPWSAFQDMRMADPIPQFSYFVKELKSRHPEFAYIHVVEPRVHGPETVNEKDIEAREQNNFLREIWSPRPYISAGAYTRDLALKTAEEKGDLIAFGRYYISNPDLPRRLREDIPFTQYNRDTFYLAGDASPTGYTDYPFAAKN
ncbi:FMN-linked oxidoreductase [Schizophyllum commune H4-8]|uniref:FMN-linked oxidoreductase n=1 Tax=Schizophyllum commune (strain H4-8 / FGSC 9210) TaxID=578458 RepID=UPI00215E3E1F|nr:FMN-linked oxidoreductase [Schizophyllum commune H4-8]KAI5892083.1 FMN-linked oxidoreductase [Schizophyllum commune H4-8]